MHQWLVANRPFMKYCKGIGLKQKDMHSSGICDYSLVKVSKPRHKKKRRQQRIHVKNQTECHQDTSGNNNQNLINIWGPIRRTKQRPKKEKQETMQWTLQPKEYDRPLDKTTRQSNIKDWIWTSSTNHRSAPGQIVLN
eukprot:9425355-Ditylum_brightwellii.AAC.1